MTLLRRYWRLPALAGIGLVALAVRLPLLGHVSSDMRDYMSWYDHIAQHGGFRALGGPIYNYSPAYMYLLALLTYLRPLMPRLLAIKGMSIAFDFAAASVMYRLVGLKHPSGAAPVLAFAAVLLAPTIVVNGSYWGQCDIIYATLLLASIYFMCREKPLLSMLSFAFALSFKAQAVFLGPLILALLLRRRIPWRYTLLVPAVFLLLAFPAILLGRPPLDPLLVYFRQAHTFNSLSMNAPNLYQFFSGQYYGIVAVFGLALAAVGSLATATAGLKRHVQLDRGLLLRGATLSVALLPFLLPKMHDRYFFAADLVSIGLAFYCTDCWLLPFIFQATSLIAYLPYLTNMLTPLSPIAAIGNTLAVGYLHVTYLIALRARSALTGAHPPSSASTP